MDKKDTDRLSKTLITGAGGMVGSYIDFGIKMRHKDLDVTDLDKVLKVCEKYKPKVILHLAAATDLNLCEENPNYAYLVNVIGTSNVCLAAKKIGAKLIYISTSGIFDGTKKSSYTEKDKPNPKSHYGRSKYLGELMVQSIMDDYIIARASWIFGGGPLADKKFVGKIIGQLKNEEIKVVTGMTGSPTYGRDLIDLIKKMINSNKKGIFHASNTGAPSRFDVASYIVKVAKSKARVVKVSPDSFKDVNSNKKKHNEGMVSKVKLMRSWQEALNEYMHDEWPNYINN